MKKNESPNAKPKKLTLNQETLANLREANAGQNAALPTLPPGCSC
jgi:hypothetical protein